MDLRYTPVANVILGLCAHQANAHLALEASWLAITGQVTLSAVFFSVSLLVSPLVDISLLFKGSHSILEPVSPCFSKDHPSLFLLCHLSGFFSSLFSE